MTGAFPSPGRGVQCFGPARRVCRTGPERYEQRYEPRYEQQYERQYAQRYERRRDEATDPQHPVAAAGFSPAVAER
ncbi:hypothetical protein ABZW18_33565 [Streptomyces sp. NPDC004647]|uniref:hypothetical protein n=1 Tax=Streptomyces sp. NPDC004647 TaxID=3154671 RepID=UPI0033A16F45